MFPFTTKEISMACVSVITVRVISTNVTFDCAYIHHTDGIGKVRYKFECNTIYERE